MPNYRRYYVAGGTYFFTLKTERNAPIFREEPNVRLLGNVFREMPTPLACRDQCDRPAAGSPSHDLVKWSAVRTDTKRQKKNSKRTETIET
jgi:hypothetical protein